MVLATTDRSKEDKQKKVLELQSALNSTVGNSQCLRLTRS